MTFFVTTDYGSAHISPSTWLHSHKHLQPQRDDDRLQHGQARQPSDDAEEG